MKCQRAVTQQQVWCAFGATQLHEWWGSCHHFHMAVTAMCLDTYAYRKQGQNGLAENTVCSSITNVYCKHEKRNTANVKKVNQTMKWFEAL